MAKLLLPWTCYFLLISLHIAAEDCNQNQIEDHVEIADQANLDCNQNGVIDECEFHSGLKFRAPQFSLPDRQFEGIHQTTIRFQQFVDINQDGVEDRLFVQQQGVIWVLLSKKDREPQWVSLIDIPEVQVPGTPFAVSFARGGDFNGDGQMDIIASINHKESENSKIQMYSGDGSLKFTHRYDLPLSLGTWTRFVGDTNGDGRDEVLNLIHQGFEVLFFNSDFSLQRKDSYSLPIKSWGQLTLIDCNNDGILDVVADDDERFRIFHGDGEGGFTNSNNLSSFQDGSDVASIGFIDSDPYPDIAYSTGRGLFVRYSTAEKTFGEKAQQVVEGRIKTFSLDDVDQDGHLDFIYVKDNEDRRDPNLTHLTVKWGDSVRNNFDLETGTGYLHSDPDLSVPWRHVRSFDFNQDQKREVVLGGTTTLSMLGPRTFDRGMNFKNLFITYGKFLSMDIDGDSSSEPLIFYTESQVDKMGQVIPGVGKAVELRPLFEFEENVRGIEVGDFDGDTLKEFLILLRTPEGEYEHQRIGIDGEVLSPPYLFQEDSTILAIVDLNDDLSDELIVKNAIGVQIFEWDVVKEEFRSVAFFTGSSFLTAGPIADFDQDGIVDLIIKERDFFRVYWGQGNFEFSAPTELDIEHNPDGQITDIDGDGDYDLVLSFFRGSRTRLEVFKNLGNREFEKSHEQDMPHDGPEFEFYDFNLDSVDDIFWLRYPIDISQGAGGGIYSLPVDYTLGEVRTHLIYDWDGDTRPDVLTANGRWISVTLNETPFPIGTTCLDGLAALDPCELVLKPELDRNENQYPDECELDCNQNNIPDRYEIRLSPGLDCNHNGRLDRCEIEDGQLEDCDLNGIPDLCDLLTLVDGETSDKDQNGILDRCEDTRCLIPGDCSLDGLVDLTDAICLLLGLFQGGEFRLPCGRGEPTDVGNQQLLDWQGDQHVDLTDAVAILRYVFLGGPPHRLSPTGNPDDGCIEVIDCN